MERMLRKKKDNSEYEIDRELTGKFAIEKNAEYQDRIAELEEENKKLKKERDLYKARNEELNENCFGLAKENKKLKSDLAFERTMLDNVRAEYKSLQNVIKKLNIKTASLEGEIKGLNSVIEKLNEENQTLELWLDRKEKLNEKYRKELKNYVYDAKQVRDIC